MGAHLQPSLQPCSTDWCCHAKEKTWIFFFGLIVLMKGHGMGGEGKEGAWRTKKKKKKPGERWAGERASGRIPQAFGCGGWWRQMATPPERSQTSGAALLPRPLAFNPLRVCMRDAQISWGLPEEVNTSTDTEPWREKNCLTTHNVELQGGGGG